MENMAPGWQLSYSNVLYQKRKPEMIFSVPKNFVFVQKQRVWHLLRHSYPWVPHVWIPEGLLYVPFYIRDSNIFRFWYPGTNSP